MKRDDVFWAWYAGMMVWSMAMLVLAIFLPAMETTDAVDSTDVSSRQMVIDHWFYAQWLEHGSVPSALQPRRERPLDEADAIPLATTGQGCRPWS